MKQLFFILSFASFILASGGDTLRFSNEVNTLADGDTFYSDKHWGSLRDSVSKIINGRLGNINIIADAQIDAGKFDTSKTAKFDSMKINTAIKAKRVRADSAIIPILIGDVATRGTSISDSFYSSKSIRSARGVFDSIKLGSGSYLSIHTAGSQPCTLSAFVCGNTFSGTKDTIGLITWERIGNIVVVALTGFNTSITAGASCGYWIKNFPSSLSPTILLTCSASSWNSDETWAIQLGTGGQALGLGKNGTTNLIDNFSFTYYLK